MPFVEKFLGRGVDIPEDRRYFPGQGLWAKAQGRGVFFGLTEPFLVLAGGFNEVEWLFEDGQQVAGGDAVVFAVTGKILYIEAPVAGAVFFNPGAKREPRSVVRDPYGEGWLFRIVPAAAHPDLPGSLDALEYLESLRNSEGFKNPEGLKGGVSGICKAVYSGIREQKIS